MLSKIFPFFRKKESPQKQDPHVNADFTVLNLDGKSQSESVREVGKILSRFKDQKMHGFGTEVSSPLSEVENALSDIVDKASKDGERMQVELRIDVNPSKDRNIAKRLASV